LTGLGSQAAHGRDEAVTPAVLDLDELRRAWVVSQRPTDLRYAHLQDAIAHHGVMPHPAEENFFGDECSGMLEAAVFYQPSPLHCIATTAC
jgi:hypothetical protein